MRAYVRHGSGAARWRGDERDPRCGPALETEEADQLNHMLAVRETMLRSVLDARFVVYHHVVRRRVALSLQAEFPEPFSAALDAARQKRLADTPLFINEQFLTLVRRPARGKAGLLERFPPHGGERGPDPRTIRELEGATPLLAALEPYGARVMGSRLIAIYNGEWRPVMSPADGVDLGHHIPYARVSFGLDTVETRRAGAIFPRSSV
jgi:type IV secretion system protein VirB4